MVVEAVGTLDVPLLILASAETDVPEGQAFYESLRALHDTYPQSTLITKPDARHYAIVTHVDQLKEHVLDAIPAVTRDPKDDYVLAYALSDLPQHSAVLNLVFFLWLRSAVETR